MGETADYDLVIVGAGPGGYVAAVRAAQLGMRVACVEREERLGGVCLRVGCIPSKALLDSSEMYASARERLADHGIRCADVKLDLAALLERKERVVEGLTDSVRDLLERNRVDVVRGTARLTSNREVAVATAGDGSEKRLAARAILLATGSEPVALEGLPFDGERIVTSTEALSFERVPEHLGVVGGGYIGLELGSVWARLGAKVTVLEALPGIASGLDTQVARMLQRLLRRQGLEILTETRVAGAAAEGDRVHLQLEGKGAEHDLVCDRVLVAVGRRPLTRDLGLDEVGLEPDPDSGRLPVDAQYRTSVEGIYAIGDLVAGPMLAHKASAEGIAAVECIAGQPGEVNYDALPAVVYTAPEVASVGLTQDQVKEREIPHCVGNYPFSGTGRARCMGETDGFVKILSHGRSGRVLGAHIIGPRASDMIAECVVALELGASAEDLARSVHAHPTFAEAIMEAARGVGDCQLYR